MNLSNDPVRTLLEKTEKKGLFKKKEVTFYAVGDENGNPLSGYEYLGIEPYEDGFAAAKVNETRSILLDIKGEKFLPQYANKGFTITRQGDLFVIDGPSGMGVADKTGYVFIEPKHGNNVIRIYDDIVIHGKQFGKTDKTIWDFNGNTYTNTIYWDSYELGASRFEDGKLVPIVFSGDHFYNVVEYIDNRVLAVGRVSVNYEQVASTGVRPGYVQQYTPRVAVRFIGADAKPLSDKIFGFKGKPKRNRDGTMDAIYYPNIRPEDLSHHQTAGEAFTGKGLLDFSGAKNVRLDQNFKVL